MAAKIALQNAATNGGTPGSPTPAGRRRALRNVDVGLSRNLVDPGHRIVIEIGLLDYAVLGGDFSAAHDARAKNHRTFELRAGRFRIYDQPRIHRCINTRDADLAVITHLHFNHRSHISQETAMRGESKPVALCALLLAQPDLSATISTTFRKRPVSQGYVL